MARKYETEYQISKTAEVLKSENDFRRSVDLRLDAIEQGLAGLGSDADVLVARVVRAIETEISPRAAEIEALLADYREGVPAALVAEEAGGRQFLTPDRRAAILAELRGGVDVSGDTLAKLLMLIGAVDAAKATPGDITAAINALKGSAPAAYDTLQEIAAWIANDETAEAAIMTALAGKADTSDVNTALANRVRVDAPSSYTSDQRRQGRANLAAAQVAASAGLGLLTNPFFEVMQENGTTLLSNIANTVVYPADQWSSLESAVTLVCSAQNVVDPFSIVAGFKRLKNSVKVIATTAQSSLSASETCQPLRQIIEGTYLRSLGWGTSDAQAILVVAILQVSVTGTYSVSMRNAASDRSYVTTVSLTANTPTAICVEIPGDTGGTWIYTSAAAAILAVCTTTGSTFETSTLNAWQSGNYLSASSSTDWQGTTNAFVQVAYCDVFPKGVLPWTSGAEINGDALQVLLGMRRAYSDELLRCHRYLEPCGAGSVGRWSSATGADLGLKFAMQKRTTNPLVLVKPGGDYTVARLGVNSYTGSGATVGSFVSSNFGAFVVFNTNNHGAATGETFILLSDTLLVNARM